MLALFFSMLTFYVGQLLGSRMQNSQIRIRAQTDSGSVTFRGAYVDGKWVSPSDHVTDGGGWNFDPDDTVYTAVDFQSLTFLLPAGTERKLVFTAGPNEGVVNVETDEGSFTYDLKNDEYQELGKSYAIYDSDLWVRTGILWISALIVFLMVLTIALIYIRHFPGYGFLISGYGMLLLILSMESSYMEANKGILLSPHPEKGMVTLRGAMIDEKWYGIDEIVEIPKGGWTRNESENTLTANITHPLYLSLPEGVERSLVFDIGPKEGTVDLYLGGNVLEWNLYREVSNEYGEGFTLPRNIYDDPVKKQIVTLYALLLLIIVMLVANLRCSGKQINAGCEKTSRNGAIELLRFFIAICVLLHHYSGLTPGGYLGVDFFFLLSGFLLMRHQATHSDACTSAAVEAVQYTGQRYKRLLPHYLFAFLLSNALAAFMWQSAPLGSLVTEHFWELTMLANSGISDRLAVGPGWYSSALLIAGFCVYYLLCKYKKTYVYVIAPLTLLVTFVWISQTTGHLNRWTQIDALIPTGTLRGFAEMGFGCICYETASRMKAKKIERCCFHTVMELLCFIYMVWVFFKAAPSEKDFVCVFAMAILLTSLFIGGSLWFKLFQNRVSNYLGSLSIGIYFTHVVLLERVDWRSISVNFGLSQKLTFLLYFLTVLLLSSMSACFVENILRKMREERCAGREK